MLLVITNVGLANSAASFMTDKSYKAETLGIVGIDDFPKISGEIVAASTQTWQRGDKGLTWPEGEETV